MFKEKDIKTSFREGVSSSRKAKPEMRLLNPGDPDMKAFRHLPDDYKDFIVQKIQTLGNKVSQHDKITIVKYFLRKYEEFVRVESDPKLPNYEQVKLVEELSSVAEDVDRWFVDLVRKHESGRQSSPGRVI